MRVLKNVSVPCLIIFIAMVSCSPKHSRTVEYAISDIELTLEGPIFEGSNDLQAKVAFSPDSILQEAGVSRENIDNIRIKSVSLEKENNFNLFESILIQLVSENQPLTSIALVSPVPKDTQKLEPEVSEMAQFEGLKFENQLYFVIDANAREEHEEDIKIKGNIIFLLDLNK